MSDEEEFNLLSENASIALLEYFEKQCSFHGTEEIVEFEEDWNLSQFWYTENTAEIICKEIEKAFPEKERRIACISCPTIFRQFKKRASTIDRVLLEIDPRFATLGNFVPYDYNNPLELKEELIASFDVVVADPPYLSEECLVKTLQTTKALLKTNAETRIYLLTGAVMKDVAFREANLKPVQFRPEHQNKLGNEFRLYVNPGSTFFIGDFEDETSDFQL